MTRVIVAGSANMDLIVRVAALPGPGETVLGADAVIRPGGKGANQAVAARRLGAGTELYAAVGDDPFGVRIRAALRDEGVGVTHLEVADAPTGIATIVVADDGENTIVVSSGANRLVGDRVLAPLADHVRPGDVVCLQLEIPVEACLDAARTAQRAGARVLLNAAPPPAAVDATFADLLREVDVLVLNEAEARALADDPPGEPAGAVAEPTGPLPRRAGGGRPPGAPRTGDVDAWARLAEGLRRHGPDACVVTLGARGAVAADGHGRWTQEPFRVAVVDTTGAGDAFCGALAAALASGHGLREAVCRGGAAGALATAGLGAQAALPTAAEVDKLLSKEMP